MKFKHLCSRVSPLFASLHRIVAGKKISGFLGVTMAVAVVSAAFFASNQSAPSVSELSFIEHSSLGQEAGSVVPASCDSNNPMARFWWWAAGGEWLRSGSHRRGDCQTKCNPNRNWMYDPYFDRNKEACPAIGNFESVNPTTCKVNGWAFDTSAHTRSIRIHVYRDGRGEE